MRTRTSLILLTLLPWLATTSFFAARRVPIQLWLDAWPILPFIAAALGGLFIAISKSDARLDATAE